MKSYRGNRFPFCCAVYTESDAAEAAAIIETLERQKIRCAVPKRRRADAVKRAAAVLLFLSPDAIRDKTVLKCIEQACAEKKTVLSVFLKETQLTPGLSMQLGQMQGIPKYRAESEEAFYQKLLGAPALQSMSVTPQQKKALRRRTLGWAIAGVLVLAAAVLIGFNWRTVKALLPTSPLRKLGVALDFDSVETLYVYGETKRDAYAIPRYQQFADGDHDWTRLEGELIPQGGIKLLDDFSLLHNLREFCICNNPIESLEPVLSLTRLTLLDVSHDSIADFSGIGALSELETLNVAHTGFSDLGAVRGLRKLRVLDISYTGLSALDVLKELPSLETVYIDASMLGAADALGDTPFAFVCVDTPVYLFEELLAALDDPDAVDICIMNSMSIPEDAALTIPSGVVLYSDTGTRNLYLNNYGTVRVFGVWEAGLLQRNIYGTVVVEDGGLYTGGMCDTFISGTFLIKSGGRHNLERGSVFYLSGGRYENNGDIYLRNGFRIRVLSGSIVNNGSLHLSSSDLDRLTSDMPVDLIVNNGRVYLDGLLVPDRFLKMNEAN